MPIAQWISGRLIAQGIRGAAWFSRSLFRARTAQPEQESGVSAAEAFAKSIQDRQVLREAVFNQHSV